MVINLFPFGVYANEVGPGGSVIFVSCASLASMWRIKAYELDGPELSAAEHSPSIRNSQLSLLMDYE